MIRIMVFVFMAFVTIIMVAVVISSTSVVTIRIVADEDRCVGRSRRGIVGTG